MTLIIEVVVGTFLKSTILMNR